MDYKKILENSILLVGEIICLVLAIIWYNQQQEMEPLILIVGLSFGILVSLFFKFNSSKKVTDSSVVAVEDVNSKGNSKIKIKEKEGKSSLVKNIESGKDTTVTVSQSEKGSTIINKIKSENDTNIDIN